MPVIDPEFAEKNFAYSFESVHYSHSSTKLKSVRLQEENFRKIVKIFETVKNLEGERWKEIPMSKHLYGGKQANQMKEVSDKNIKDVIRNAFAEHEPDYSDEADYYPTYLSITKEIRLFGYQWKGVFNIVLIDLTHKVHKRK